MNRDHQLYGDVFPVSYAYVSQLYFYGSLKFFCGTLSKNFRLKHQNYLFIKFQAFTIK